MDDNVGKALTGLFVAAIGALTFVAYKHPLAYSKLGLWLALANALLAASFAVWNTSNQILLAAIMSSGLVVDKASEISSISKGLMVSLWIMILPVCATLYNLFLLSFPRWLLEPEPPKGKADRE